MSYTTKELSKKTWPDFEKLFSQGNGWDSCRCMHFHRPRGLPKEKWLPTRAARGVRNREEKRVLVEEGRSHGILVYEDGEPVGWCQYGLQQELPRIDNSRNYPGPPPEKSGRRLWRITCFVVHKKYRRRGIASVALKAVLESIRKKGGGVVEAFPLAEPKTSTFGNMSTHGTVSMFEKEKFKTVGTFGTTNVVMRRTVASRST